ncbi:UDP-N-acetylmuramate dehydrogenase [Vibrio misgurnus]|uniref:UDP-N-acetylmuramate dehydrogenase n=1 Tax=Vibrio misgurnus TaxID=2993714 RepID=UPI0024164155|nr:UDP-N-acetylmuramate dehydrogenase [Vibrio sp. gvc]
MASLSYPKTTMQIQLGANLKPYHTFGIEQFTAQLAVAESIDDLQMLYCSEQWANVPKLMLGKGSNMLFTCAYSGMVVLNRLRGIEHRQDEQHHLLHIAGGEDWSELVAWCVDQGIAGLENLALIPGCAGSAPIQNIGAYGLEFKDVCHYVDYLCLESGSIKRLMVDQCQFGYRDSIFKHQLYQKAVVVAVGLKLAKAWQPIINYGPLKDLPQTATAYDVYQRVCATRIEKLPDPAVMGNAGSFFKNPLISVSAFADLQAQYPGVVAYPTDQGVKIAAGWLIDQAGLKGWQIGGAKVHPKQALVIVNTGSATAADVLQLAAYVKQRVLDCYGIELEHEVRFIGAQQETNLEQWMSEQS